MNEIDLVYNNLVDLKAVDRILLGYGLDLALVERDGLTRVADTIRNQLSWEGDSMSVQNQLADLKDNIHSILSDIKQADYFELFFKSRTPIIYLSEVITDKVAQFLKDKLESIEPASRPLAFDIISLNSNLENSVHGFIPEQILPFEKLPSIITEFKSINFEWLQEKVQVLTSLEDARGIISYCLLDSATMFANLSNLRKPYDLTQQGLQEMAEWLRQNTYLYARSEEYPEFIELLSYYLEKLQTSAEYFDEAATLNNLPNLSEELQSEFR